jgi:hypothetical protein
MQPAKQPRESLAILAAMRWASSQILPVISSFRPYFASRIQVANA